MFRKSIFITGNYLKLARGLSQTPWIVDGERKTEGSVEEYVLAVFKEFFDAQVYKFHSAGREDVDVRMLFDGRPFVGYHSRRMISRWLRWRMPNDVICHLRSI